MTRAMFVTVLYRADDNWYDEKADFIDVSVGAWYYDAVAWASANGLVTGTDSQHFSPNRNITREQMVAILYRYLGYADAVITPATTERPLFRDRDKISSYAREAVEEMQYAEIIRGKPAAGGGLNFDPQGRATRAEAACVLCRFFDQLSWEEEPETPEEVFDKMEEVMESDQLDAISKAYSKASESGKKECMEQAITYFEMLEENGDIDDLTVDRANRSLSYEIGGVECAYLLYNMREELAGTGGTPSAEAQLSSSALTSPVIGTSAGAVRTAVAQKPSHKALVLESYASSAAGELEADFHTRSQEYHDQLEGMENCTVSADIHYNMTVDSLKRGLDAYDIIMVNSHGAFSDGEPFIALEEEVTLSKRWDEYYADCEKGRTVVYGVLGIPHISWFGVRGAFFEHYYDGTKQLKAKWVHLGTCFGTQNSELAEGLLAAGAENVTGYGSSVSLLFDIYCIHGMTDRLSREDTIWQAADYGDAYGRKETDYVAELISKLRPKLTLYGELDTTFAYVGRGKIMVQLQPDQGTVSKGRIHTYKLEGTQEIPVGGDTQFTGSSFVIGELDEGARYKVEIVADGYHLATLTTTAVKDPTTQIVNLTENVIDLDPIVIIRTVNVIVEDFDTGAAIPGAQVTLSGRASSSGGDTQLAVGTTDSSGRFVSKASSKYSYLTAEATKNGYVRGSTEVTGSGVNMTITVTLSKEPDLTPDPDVPSGYTPIYTFDDLKALNERGEGAKGILMNDITVPDGQFIDTWYKGAVLDGNSHTIINANRESYDSEYWVGWINTNNGLIRNVHFRNVDIFTVHVDAGVIGQNNGTIENCVVESGNVEGLTAGGLVGGNGMDGVIRNCVNKASVSAGMSGEPSPAAHASGIAAANFGIIDHCLNLGKISAAATNVVGMAGISKDYKTIDGYRTPTNCGNGGELSAQVDGNTVSCYNISQYAKEGYAVNVGKNENLTKVTMDNLLRMWADVLG